jgi:hypothetical protein
MPIYLGKFITGYYMEVIIFLGIIIFLINASSKECEHEWEDAERKVRYFLNVSYIKQHKCKKCGKTEDCIDEVDSWTGDAHCVICGRCTYYSD